MAVAFALPRPALGEHFERQCLDGMMEEALIISIKYMKENPIQWTAVLSTRNGYDFIASQKEFRTINDWRPKGWVYMREIGAFAPPNAVWNTETQTLEGLVEDHTETVTQVPYPYDGEKYLSWRARAFRALPDLKGNPQDPEILSVAWKKREETYSAAHRS